eukprot:4188930-Pyramimonas_sp.AAC.1
MLGPRFEETAPRVSSSPLLSYFLLPPASSYPSVPLPSSPVNHFDTPLLRFAAPQGAPPKAYALPTSSTAVRGNVGSFTKGLSGGVRM